MSDGLGKHLRMSRILNPSTGNGIVVAMDHGLFLGPIKGVENIREAVERVVEGQPDALQVTAGVASAIEKFLVGKNAPGFVLRVDATTSGGQNLSQKKVTMSLSLRLKMLFGWERMRLWLSFLWATRQTLRRLLTWKS